MAEAGLAAATGVPLDVGKNLVIEPVIDEITGKSGKIVQKSWMAQGPSTCNKMRLRVSHIQELTHKVAEAAEDLQATGQGEFTLD